jgi:hypothetical protein
MLNISTLQKPSILPWLVIPECNCKIRRSSRISSKLSRKHSTDQNQVHPNLKVVQRRCLEIPWVGQNEGCLLVEPQCNLQKQTYCIPRLLAQPRRLKIWVYLLVSSFTIQLLLCFFPLFFFPSNFHTNSDAVLHFQAVEV